MDLDLTLLTEEELLDLNRRVVDRIRLLRQTRHQAAILEFRVGDRVSFRRECGHEVIGTVVRRNRRTVTVIALDGQSWRVSPAFLTRADGGPGTEAEPLPDNLLPFGPRRDRGEA
jgi:hypothetical protein